MVPGLRFTGLHCTLVLKSDELISKFATVPEIEPAELVKLAPKEKDTLRAGDAPLFEIYYGPPLVAICGTDGVEVHEPHESAVITTLQQPPSKRGSPQLQ